jgi:hypothetical protein
MAVQTDIDWMREQLTDAQAQGRIIPLTGHGSLTDPHRLNEASVCVKCGVQR